MQQLYLIVLFLLLHDEKSTKHLFAFADIQYSQEKIPIFTVVTPNVTDIPIKNPCILLQNDFARSIGDFMECAGLNSSPLHFCLSCVEKFLVLSQQYNNITDTTQHDEEGRRCFNSLVTSDKINVLHHIHALALSLWSNAHCNNCFASKSLLANGSAVYELRKDVTRFMDLNKNATICFEEVNKTRNGSVCKTCKWKYRKADKAYEDMQNRDNRQVCIDVTDAINRTRRLWSRRYECHTVTRDDLPVAVLSAFVLVFPAVFYIGNAVNGTRQRRNIVKQKRMTARLRSRTAPELRRLLPGPRGSPPPVLGSQNPLTTVLEESDPTLDTVSPEDNANVRKNEAFDEEANDTQVQIHTLPPTTLFTLGSPQENAVAASNTENQPNSDQHSPLLAREGELS